MCDWNVENLFLRSADFKNISFIDEAKIKIQTSLSVVIKVLEILKFEVLRRFETLGSNLK